MKFSYRAVQVSDLPEYTKDIDCEVYLNPSMDYYQDFCVDGVHTGYDYPSALTWGQICKLSPSATVYVKA